MIQAWGTVAAQYLCEIFIAIYLCENNRYVWDTRGNKSSCWDKQQVVEKSGFPLIALPEIATGHDITILEERQRGAKVLCAPLNGFYKISQAGSRLKNSGKEILRSLSWRLDFYRNCRIKKKKKRNRVSRFSVSHCWKKEKLWKRGIYFLQEKSPRLNEDSR